MFFIHTETATWLLLRMIFASSTRCLKCKCSITLHRINFIWLKPSHHLWYSEPSILFLHIISPTIKFIILAFFKNIRDSRLFIYIIISFHFLFISLLIIFITLIKLTSLVWNLRLLACKWIRCIHLHNNMIFKTYFVLTHALWTF